MLPVLTVAYLQNLLLHLSITLHIGLGQDSDNKASQPPAIVVVEMILRFLLMRQQYKVCDIR